MEECFAVKNPDTVNRSDYAIAHYRPGVDDLEEITAVLHRAHAPLLAAGMNYSAATQSPDMTGKRLRSAHASWIVRAADRIIGTVCYYSRVTYHNAPPWFQSGTVGVFAQFAVDPPLQSRGIGQALLHIVEQHAKADEKYELACDTAQNATHLREYYAMRGFREVAAHSYPNATYTSIILSKTLNGASPNGV